MKFWIEKQRSRSESNGRKKGKREFLADGSNLYCQQKKSFSGFVCHCVYLLCSMNKVSVNQDITKYLPADSETRIGLTLMDEQFMTYGSARIMVSNITWQDADALVEKLEAVEGVKEVAFDDSADHYNGTNALFDVTFDGTEEDEISKDAKQAVKELLSDYDTYISTSVGAEEEQTESLNNDMNAPALKIIFKGVGQEIINDLIEFVRIKPSIN